MQLTRFASLLLLAGSAAALSPSSLTSAGGATSGAASAGGASSAAAIPEAAVKYVLAQTGIDLMGRNLSPLTEAKMARVSKKRQTAGGDNINVSGDCSQGKAQCCDTIMSGDKSSEMTSLLGAESLVGAVGINCVQLPINVIGVSGALANTCKSTPVCCQNVTQNGLINLGCNALPIN